ncbi:hypothetical protein [Olleya sp. YS]|uniref:energy transducer TonB n=1 Tax=Olleya sp. YS TaxID=3028318 RepID=UPI00243411C6|nr:hypothetical protein [Olleya sp. YS]WGD33498.1 hypothetical protein Ollyesu_06865 [Olleya sp. YS]
MASYYSIKIPKPCHEGWDTMTPKEKGRFCSACNKTVVDFTKMDTYQIQDFLIENKDQRICGHIKQSQLDSINLRIPLGLIQQNHSVYKSFFLAVLIVMGTSLFSCSTNNGKPKKIDSIEVIDTTNNQVFDILGKIAPPNIDTVNYKKTECKTPKKISQPPIPALDGLIITNTITTGEVATISNPVKTHSVNVNKPIDIIEGDISFEKNRHTEPFLFSYVDDFPKFIDTPQNLSKQDEKAYFQNKLAEFIKANFDISKTKQLGLKGKQRVYINFEIDTTGSVIIKNIKAAHKSLEIEAKRVLEKLPEFISAKHDGKSVAVLYTLPIIFNVEE